MGALDSPFPMGASPHRLPSTVAAMKPGGAAIPHPTDCSLYAASSLPIGRRPVVIMDVSLPVSADHTGIPARREYGGIAELVFRDVELVGVELRVVAQHAPRQCAIFVADPEEAAKRHDRIRDLSGELIDHDTLDRTEFRSIRAPNRGTFDFVACDQAGSFASSDLGSNSSCHLHLLLSNADTRITAGKDDAFPQNFRPTR